MFRWFFWCLFLPLRFLGLRARRHHGWGRHHHGGWGGYGYGGPGYGGRGFGRGYGRRWGGW